VDPAARRMALTTSFAAYLVRTRLCLPVIPAPERDSQAVSGFNLQVRRNNREGALVMFSMKLVLLD
jgi:hypothetical protein